MQKINLAGAASAWQYQDTEESIEALKRLTLPTGEVTLQLGDEMNNIAPRCYVPVAWGTHILEPGDWIVLTDSGIVLTFTEKQMPFVVEVQSISEQRDGLLGRTQQAAKTFEPREAPLVLAFDSTRVADVVSHIERANELYRTDWALETQHDFEQHQVVFVLLLAATGRELGRWTEQDSVRIFLDGTVEVVS